jgi:putative transposase
VLNQIRVKRGAPKMLFHDNGSEFTSPIMDLWAYQNGCGSILVGRGSRPITLTSRPLTERCDRMLGHALADAKESIEARRTEYNVQLGVN